MVQIRVPTFIFENLTYREKVRALRHFRPITPSARNVGPPRSKRCDGKSISLRQKATLKDHSEARPAACLAAVNGQHTVFNADTGSHSFFSYETVEPNILFRLTCLSLSVALYTSCPACWQIRTHHSRADSTSLAAGQTAACTNWLQ